MTVIKLLSFGIPCAMNPLTEFHSDAYLAHTSACFNHLDRIVRDLNLSMNDKTLLDLGAGIGDQAIFWQNKGARVTVIEGRQENIDVMLSLLNGIEIIHADLDDCENLSPIQSDIVFS